MQICCLYISIHIYILIVLHNISGRVLGKNDYDQQDKDFCSISDKYMEPCQGKSKSECKENGCCWKKKGRRGICFKGKGDCKVINRKYIYYNFVHFIT